MSESSATRFQLVVLYDWKPGVTPARIAWHADRIRALPRAAPGLIEARFGPRLCGHPEAETRDWDHAAVLVFDRHADFIALGPTAAHEAVANELVADLERISYVGFSG